MRANKKKLAFVWMPSVWVKPSFTVREIPHPLYYLLVLAVDFAFLVVVLRRVATGRLR
jgi:hypothetical protein